MSSVPAAVEDMVFSYPYLRGGYGKDQMIVVLKSSAIVHSFRCSLPDKVAAAAGAQNAGVVNI